MGGLAGWSMTGCSDDNSQSIQLCRGIPSNQVCKQLPYYARGPLQVPFALPVKSVTTRPVNVLYLHYNNSYVLVVMPPRLTHHLQVARLSGLKLCCAFALTGIKACAGNNTAHSDTSVPVVI